MAASDTVAPPEGFVLDKPDAGLSDPPQGSLQPPEGFVLDIPRNALEGDLTASGGVLDGPSAHEIKTRLLDPLWEQTQNVGEEARFAKEGDPVKERHRMLLKARARIQRQWLDKLKQEDAEFETVYPKGSIKEVGEFGKVGDTEERRPLRDQLEVAKRVLFIPDDRERAQALESMGFTIDNFAGRQLATSPDGETFVVNYPGISTQDFITAAAQVATFVPAARLAGAGRGVFSKTALGSVGAGATSAALQNVQKSLGGDFDVSEVVLDAALGGGAEALSPLFGRIWSGFSSSKRQAIANARTLDDLSEAGLTREEMASVRDSMRDAMELADDLDVPRPLAAQAVAGEAVSDFQQPLADIVTAASDSPEMARRLKRILQGQSRGLEDAARNVFNRLSVADPGTALEGARKTARDVIQGKVDARRGFADIMYEDAFMNAPKIDVEPLRKRIDDLIASDTAPNTPARRRLGQIKRMLTTDDFEAGSATVREMDPRILQEVNWVLRDMKRLKTDASTVGSVKHKAGILEREVTSLLDQATQGKYSKADAKFRSMSEAIDELSAGAVGSAASRKEVSLKSIVTSIFNPKPEQAKFSTRFMELLRGQDPQAASDLYATYFTAKLDDLGENATSTDILKAVFGKTENTANMAVRLAPDNASRLRLTKIRKALETASKGDKVDLEKTAERFAELKESAISPQALAGRALTWRQTGRRFFDRFSLKHRARMMFEAAVNEKWSRELDEVLKLPPSSKEIENAYDNFYKRMWVRSNQRSLSETLAKAAIPASIDKTEKENDDTKSDSGQ